ncbi:UPF0426 protein At1g28150, chloroplastic [Diospyros lotus]|uniref:UPF0426 protein At1g28150, chloroplastic n=1 Tax=Diospyros lotus TaxID=55363 RepID=UPI0022526AEC|nr:UPF0426 protein At1g28150, chloroplastic [Diospyros lotus]
MYSILYSPPYSALCKARALVLKQSSSSALLSPSLSSFSKPKPKRRLARVNALFCNPIDGPPLLKEAIKEPIAFMGGIFAGILRLDLKEDPLKEWVARTVEASGIAEEEIDGEGTEPEEDSPQQIEIE